MPATASSTIRRLAATTPTPRESQTNAHPCFSPNICSNARLTIGDARFALSNFDNVAVRIADVAANLARFVHWLRDELGSAAAPEFIARLNIGNANIHKAADGIWVGRNGERHRRFV